MKEQKRSGRLGILCGVVGRRALADGSPEVGLPKPVVSGKRMRGWGGREAGDPSAPELLLSPPGSH